MVLTGSGKGKSSSAFGMVARALGWEMRVGIVQFIKGKWQTGEKHFFRRFPELVTFEVMGEGFTWDVQDRQRDIAAAQQGLAAQLRDDPRSGVRLRAARRAEHRACATTISTSPTSLRS